ncbi:DUF1467 family protein [Tropicimonas sp. IMCC34011]|uniref:DUF1467 family protein n=1 Tax=Tropicimonas sp. IMCC34011 TaxID=2248759 RepID=UPI000E249D72|nr:DUF1467 family protein [Tropicimonas sp. IMCC34011]
MSIASVFVVLAVLWFLVLFLVLPVRLKTQGDVGALVPGTHKSAPEDFRVGRTALIVTAITIPLWLLSVFFIVTDYVTLDDFDLYKRFGPNGAPLAPPSDETGG